MTQSGLPKVAQESSKRKQELPSGPGLYIVQRHEASHRFQKSCLSVVKWTSGLGSVFRPEELFEMVQIKISEELLTSSMDQNNPQDT